MSEILKVKDIMTAGWIATLSPDDNAVYAAKLFGEYNYDGFPVIDKDKKLVGIVTAYDLVSGSVAEHLASLKAIFESLEKDETPKESIDERFKKIELIKIREIMNDDPLTITPDMTIEKLVKEFAGHHRVNPIPVIDNEEKLVGVVSRYDLIHFFDRTYLDKVMVSNGHELLLQKLGKLSNK